MTAAAGDQVRNRALLAGGSVVLIGVIAFLALKGPAPADLVRALDAEVIDLTDPSAG